MGSLPWYSRYVDWLVFLPVRFAFRIIWLMAKVNGDARDVYRAMWDANLDLPPLSQQGKGGDA